VRDGPPVVLKLTPRGHHDDILLASEATMDEMLVELGPALHAACTRQARDRRRSCR
jgi:hypothetical protein